MENEAGPPRAATADLETPLTAVSPGASPLKTVMHMPQENAYIESVYESVLLASGMLGHIERGSEELSLLRNAIQDVGAAELGVKS